MRRNVSGQFVGAQMVNASTGAAFTGAVTVYVTGNAGTQAIGSVGSGACTHEGNGFHTYAPAQAETNYTHVAFTFIGTGAIPATVQIYPTSYDANGRADLGQISGADVSTSTAQLGVNTVQAGGTAWGSGAITAASIASGAFTAAKFAAGAFDAVWSVATRLLTAGTNIVLAKGTGVTGFNDIAATDVVSAGAITTSGGAVSTVTNVTNLHASAATSANQTTLLNRIGAFTGSGTNTILGFFQALLRSDALTLPTDIGGTYDNTTDSQQALRDHVGDGTNLTEAGGNGDHLTQVTAATVGDKTGYSISGTKTTLDALQDLTAAQVNAEMVDALDTDVYTTPAQGAPPASASIATMLRYLFFPGIRNRSTADGSNINFYADDGTTVIFKKAISDNGTTYDESEAVTGP